MPRDANLGIRLQCPHCGIDQRAGYCGGAMLDHLNGDDCPDAFEAFIPLKVLPVEVIEDLREGRLLTPTVDGPVIDGEIVSEETLPGPPPGIKPAPELEDHPVVSDLPEGVEGGGWV